MASKNIFDQVKETHRQKRAGYFSLIVSCLALGLVLLQFFWSPKSPPAAPGNSAAVFDSTFLDSLRLVNQDSLRPIIIELAMLIGGNKLAIDSLKNLLAHPVPRPPRHSKLTNQLPQIDFTEYADVHDIGPGIQATDLTYASEGLGKWIELEIPDEQRVYDQSIVQAKTKHSFALGELTVPVEAIVEGECRLRRNILEIDFTAVRFAGQTYSVSGQAYDDQFAPGLRSLVIRRNKVFLSKTKSAVQSLMDLVDPSTISSSLLDVEISSEYYTDLSAGQIIFTTLERQ